MNESSSSEVVAAEIVSAPSSQPTGVSVSLRFFPMAFFLLFCTPTVVINGVSHRLAWGTHYIDLQAGAYTVEVFFAYLFFPKCGANSVTFDLHQGTVRTVSFFMWPWMLAKGSMSVT